MTSQIKGKGRKDWRLVKMGPDLGFPAAFQVLSESIATSLRMSNSVSHQTLKKLLAYIA